MAKSVKEIDKKYVTNTYNRYDLEITEGMGVNCYDIDGKEYIDLSSGIGVNSLGFCDMGWVASVTQQVCKLNHTSNLFYSQPCALLAKALCERTGYEKVFFANSGAEANEGAIKTARKYSFDKYGKDRNKNHYVDKLFSRKNGYYFGGYRSGRIPQLFLSFYRRFRICNSKRF